MFFKRIEFQAAATHFEIAFMHLVILRNMLVLLAIFFRVRPFVTGTLHCLRSKAEVSKA